MVIAVIPNALEDFQKNQIPHSNNAFDDSGIESVGMAARNTIQIVDPNAGIDQNQLPPRISSRSPSHLIRPRSLRISCCWLRRTRSLSPCSTASFLVLKPEAFRALAISLSSMTMLVLINHLVCIL